MFTDVPEPITTTTASERHFGRVEQLATIVGVITVCCAPWLAWLAGVRASEVAENRPFADAPRVEAGRWFDPQFYAELDRYWVDRLPLRQESAGAVNAALVGVFGESPVDDAFVQRDGTWFLAEDFLQACSGAFPVDELASAFSAWADASPGSPELWFVVAPDKSAVATGDPTLRTRAADNCQVQRETALRTAFADSGVLVDVWTPLREAATQRDDERLYFVNDSHWTFRGATEMAAEIVNSAGAPIGVEFDRDHVVELGEFELTGDVTRRLSLQRRETVPLREVRRPGVATSTTVEMFDAAEGVRTHRSTSGGAPLVGGRTVVLHDSMMNYAERMLAPYFEHVEFVHWNDVDAGGFFDRVAGADRVIVEVVQRDVYARTRQEFLEAGFTARMQDAMTR